MNGQIQNIALSEQKLKTLIQTSIQEAISREIIKLKAAFLPFVSSVEQRDIERLYKKPSRQCSKIAKIEI